MAKIRPSMRSTETYTESNFLRLHTRGPPHDGDCAVTLEHLSYSAPAGDTPARGWRCLTIVDGETMSREDALFIAQAYAAENSVPVIYASHGD